MQYFHTMVRISDIEESLDFYCAKLGMKEVKRVEDEEEKCTSIFLASPEDQKDGADNSNGFSPRLRDYHATLELLYKWSSNDRVSVGQCSNGCNFGHIAYQVENIYETCQRLMDVGVVINRPPRDGRMACVKSPDGISIELLHRSGNIAPSEPWVSMEDVDTC